MHHLLPAGVSLSLIVDLLTDDAHPRATRENAIRLLAVKLQQRPMPFTRAHLPELTGLMKRLASFLVFARDPQEVRVEMYAICTMALHRCGDVRVRCMA